MDQTQSVVVMFKTLVSLRRYSIHPNTVGSMKICINPGIGDLGRSNDVDRRSGPKPGKYHLDPKMENGHGHAPKADIHGLMHSTAT